MAKAAACKCKKSEEECECPEWIFTFADLVMLMMGFFVILWVLKPPAGKDGDPAMEKDWLELVAKIREAFKYEPDPTGPLDKVDRLMLENKIKNLSPRKGPGMGGKTKIERRGTDGTDPETTAIRPGKHATVGAPIPFDIGQTALTADAKRRLAQIAVEVGGYKYLVLIKGHASLDDLPESATPQQKMDLSLRRAQVVADHLAGLGVKPEILRVQGCSVFEPIVERVYSPELRMPNRRVEVQTVDMVVSELQGRPRAATRPTTATAAFELDP